ncbi:MAG: ferrous iron transport protein B [Eubacteriales bacterium SKADARSKE-1]|nr:ferrous iron transport protein B [Eubacteriales bacterium SKADARSKE-1]
MPTNELKMNPLKNQRKHLKSHSKKLSFALIGNPNCGKTTLFNQLTGSRQYVGNWPGVTVEKKEGNLKLYNTDINIIDLPGIYSLSPYSSEEIITRNCLIREKVDLIINIVDATNIERNLYLTTQLMELGLPMVIVLNMTDLLEKKGDTIDYEFLKQVLNIPVVPISANKGIGINELLKLSLDFAKKHKELKVKNIYSKDIDKILNSIENVLNETTNKININNRWVAIKLFEDDILVLKSIKLTKLQEEKISKYKNMVQLSKHVDRQMLLADARYKYICSICKIAVHKKNDHNIMTLTDKIDRVVTNKFLALPIFFALILLIFYTTFGPIGIFLKDQTNFLINNIFGNLVLNTLNILGASEWTKSLIVGGIIEGVGSVISFLPQITILFTLLSILEDSGYMARAAFITDKLLRRVGLSGRAFVPLLMGFGCSVPAILGTRILERENEKKLAILMVPFMSCSAKMPVYSMFIAAFFSKNQPFIIFSIYIIGILAAIFTTLIFKRKLLKGTSSSFIMELPEYKLPTIKNLTLHVWERVRDFLVKAGTVLLGAAIIIWFLQSFDTTLHLIEDSSQSILAAIGTRIAPIFTICGFNDWRASVSLLCGLVAKESVVSTMAVLYNTGSGIDLATNISQNFSALSAFSFMTFVLLYTPCIAAVSAIKKETKSILWTCFIVFYQLFIAWFFSACVFQFGNLFLNFAKF